MCVAGYLWKPEEEIGSPETGVVGDCDQPYVGDGPSASVFNC